MVRLLPLAAMALLAACNNPCQALCVEMAQYARECGFDVPSSDVQTCVEANANPTLEEGDAQLCFEASDPVQLREWWTCDDLAENYEGAAP